MNQNLDTENSEDDEENWCNKKFCWWAPSPDSIPGSFCAATTIHGLPFLGHAKRHLTEKLFWLVICIASLFAAVYLIRTMWDRYERTPVIVSFQSTEQNIDAIPFPAVTVCNGNKFRKAMVEELIRLSKLPSHPKHKKAKENLKFIRNICGSQEMNFARKLGYAFSRIAERWDFYEGFNDTVNTKLLMDFLMEYTIPCKELIPDCRFGRHERICERIFKPIITDYGKCCTFNILPLPLLLQNQKTKHNSSVSIFDNPALGTKEYWYDTDTENWEGWNYDKGFVVEEGQDWPKRQIQAGLPFGLSLIIDADTMEKYACPTSNSKGVRYILHNPLEMPHVTKFASNADIGKEILVKVHPDMTNADEDIRSLDPKQRKCLYGKENSLKLFGPYTGGNCLNECTSLILARSCNCTFFYMPRDVDVGICNHNTQSKDGLCMHLTQSMKPLLFLEKQVKIECGHCYPLCNDITYTHETTTASLQDASRLWLAPYNDQPVSDTITWENHTMIVLHIFFGSETTVPKVRHRLYGTTDLIANIGGILGICLGISVLSIVEVFYFMTLRAFWKYCCNRKRWIRRKVAKRFNQMFKSTDNRVVCVNPNFIPVYPATF